MFDILKKMLDKTDINQLSEKIVLNLENGYELFGRYTITKVDRKYVVNNYNTYLDEQFYSLKNAVIWVTLYANNNIADAKRVMSLDSALEGANFEIDLNDSLLKKSKNLETKSIYVAKIVENKAKKTIIKKELDQFEKMVKKWQYNQFSKLTA